MDTQLQTYCRRMTLGAVVLVCVALVCFFQTSTASLVLALVCLLIAVGLLVSCTR